MTKDPVVCTHRRTDHRGSNKQVKKTYCLDCGTYIDSVAQSIAKTTPDNPWISEEEQTLLDRVGDHNTIKRDVILAAVTLMHHEASKLETGDYTLLRAGTLFLDCCDRSVAEDLQNGHDFQYTEEGIHVH